MLRKPSSFIFSLSILLLTSCSELLYLSVEQLVPPEVIPDQTPRSVGVVSNFSANNVIVADDGVVVFPCDADSVKEHVALTFANAGILERVVVLDSLLYHPDSTSLHTLTQDEVNTLCHELDVEMIYTIDYACITFNPAERYVRRPFSAYLCTHTYTPDTDSLPATRSINKKMLEYWADSADDIERIAPQIPSLLAESVVSAYLPSWKERERVYYYDRLCYELREAKVYIEEADWESAARQWHSLTEDKLRIYRYMAHYNLALYHEMTDDIDEALHSLDLAEDLATKRNKQGKETGITIDTSLLKQYREVLQNRKKEIEKLQQHSSSFSKGEHSF